MIAGKDLDVLSLVSLGGVLLQELIAQSSGIPPRVILSFVILSALAVGNAIVWIRILNWIHHFPLSCRTLKTFGNLHSVMILLGAAVLFGVRGLTGPELLSEGRWSQLTLGHSVFVGLGMLGLVDLIQKSIRHQFPPVVRHTQTTSAVPWDCRTSNIGPKNGPWKYQLMARLPGNQQFHVEFNDKEFQFVDLPQEFDGLTILHISDWHFLGVVPKEFFVKVSQLAAQQPVDLICFTGDLIDNQDLVAWIPETLGLLAGRLGNYFILGNHDWYQEPEEIRNMLTSLGWFDISSRCVDLNLDGKTLQIGGDETPWMGTKPAFSSATDFRILLSHTPDHFQFAQDERVDLMLAGHTHGGQIQLPIFGPIYSPSKYDTRFASGIFWQAPTLMHVSRGLSGRHPLRYNCTPELTRITLRSASAP